ncbi:MAG: SCO family protein [Pirellulaceae bacterium]|jgi:cytochrome oxidase Cu insertion factor (SCO1/SenC/PrrC family)|nr:SCO family protein [Pirellulaceae bacterium]
MNKTGKLAIAFLFLVGGVLALVTAAARSRRAPPATISPLATPTLARSNSTEILTEYTLTEQSGQEFRSADLTGTPHVVNFFFASCPSYCRMQSMEVQKLAAEFGPDGVLFLSITCDPDNDSPAALQRYAGMFNADPENWKFLTGDMLLLRRIGAEIYGVPVDTQTHSEHLIVIDKWGQPRGRFRWRNHPEELVELRALLPKLLDETEPPPEPPKKPAPVFDEETGLPIVPPADSANAARQVESQSPQVKSRAPQEESQSPQETPSKLEAAADEQPVDEATPEPLPEPETAAPSTRTDS